MGVKPVVTATEDAAARWPSISARLEEALDDLLVFVLLFDVFSLLNDLRRSRRGQVAIFSWLVNKER